MPRKKKRKGYYERSGLYGAIDQLGRVNFYGSGTGRRRKKKKKRKGKMKK